MSLLKLGTSLNLLEPPAAAAAHLVMLACLDEVTRAREHLPPAAPPEAVHDFRVALRRFRSWERAVRPQLDPGMPRKLRKRIRRLADVADPSRNAAVQLEWLRGELPMLTPAERDGAEWLVESLNHAKAMADARLLALVDSDFAATRRRIKRLLRRSPSTPARHPTCFADVIARRITRYAEELRERLAAVRTATDQRETHAARIAGKRLRYVLELVVPYAAGADLAVGRLKALQDTAGAMHDARVFSDEIVAAAETAAAIYAKRLTIAVVYGDPSAAADAQRQNPTPGVLAIAARLRERQAHAFRTLRGEWLGGEADGFLNEVQAIADGIWSEYCSKP